MATISTTMPPKKKPKVVTEHPSITKAKNALKPKKTPKPNKKESKLKKSPEIIIQKCVVEGRWRDTDSGEMKDATDLFLNRIALAAIQWSKKPDSIILSQFCNAVNMSLDSFNEFANKNKRLKEARKIMHQGIADNRERGSIMGAYSPAAVIPFQGMRSPEFKEHMKWKAELARDNNQEDKKIVVQIEAITPMCEKK